jgi:hypothetical protein
MATTKKNAAAKPRTPRKKPTVNGTTPPTETATDKDLTEGNIETVVMVPVKEIGAADKGEKVGPLRVNVYEANVRHKHLTPGAKDDYQVQVKIYAQPNSPVDLQAAKEGAVELVNDAHSLDLDLTAETVTVKLVLLDSYISE